VPASRKPTPVTITATQPMRSIGWSRRVVDRLDWRAKDQPTLPSYGREGLIYRNAVRIKSPILSKALLGVQDGSQIVASRDALPAPIRDRHARFIMLQKFESAV
jgi:Cft2 family RNA processing exonuclease